MPYQFQGQRSSEEVVLFCRQHPFVLLHPFVVGALVLLVPVAFTVFFSFSAVLSALIVICLLLAGFRFLTAWHRWWNSVMLLTNERLVKLDQRGLFDRQFTECDLDNIRQVSHEIKGFLRTVCNFGTITVHTGGGQSEFDIPNLPDPYDLQQEILRTLHGEGLAE